MHWSGHKKKNFKSGAAVTHFPFIFSDTPAVVAAIATDFFLILFLFGLRVRDLSLKLRPVQFIFATVCVQLRLPIMSPIMLIMCTNLSGFNAALNGFGANKRLEHRWDGMIHKVRISSAVVQYISSQWMPLVQSKCLVRTNSCINKVIIETY